ncbi:MAG: hypothetical protein V7740_11810 [Pseudomonas marincola]
MKRQNQNKKQNQTKSAPRQKKATTRRAFFRNIGNGAIGAAIVGGGVWFVVDEVMATLDEQDLSKIGNGIPTIVQIHDPQCSLCIALQRETRKALKKFDEGKLQYLVANIKGVEGRALAASHGVRHVTLVLFDGNGKRQQILAGSNQSSFLTDVFQRHLDKYGKR